MSCASGNGWLAKERDVAKTGMEQKEPDLKDSNCTVVICLSSCGHMKLLYTIFTTPTITLTVETPPTTPKTTTITTQKLYIDHDALGEKGEEVEDYSIPKKGPDGVREGGRVRRGDWLTGIGKEAFFMSVSAKTVRASTLSLSRWLVF